MKISVTCTYILELILSDNIFVLLVAIPKHYLFASCTCIEPPSINYWRCDKLQIMFKLNSNFKRIFQINLPGLMADDSEPDEQHRRRVHHGGQLLRVGGRHHPPGGNLLRGRRVHREARAPPGLPPLPSTHSRSSFDPREDRELFKKRAVVSVRKTLDMQ